MRGTGLKQTDTAAEEIAFRGIRFSAPSNGFFLSNGGCCSCCHRRTACSTSDPDSRLDSTWSGLEQLSIYGYSVSAEFPGLFLSYCHI